jgi:hypothetical protein
MAEVELYLLRVWRQVRGACGFRASVRAVDRDTFKVFSDPVQLADYLKAEAAKPEQSTAPTVEYRR